MAAIDKRRHFVTDLKGILSEECRVVSAIGDTDEGNRTQEILSTDLICSDIRLHARQTRSREQQRNRKTT